MYAEVRAAGKFVMIHSCGDVDELFDDLVAIGLNCFNPFQPEVMDVCSLLPRYRGRLAFHGGLSTQRTLPFGTWKTCGPRSAACSSWDAKAVTSSPPPMTLKGTCRWRNAGGHRNGPATAGLRRGRLKPALKPDAPARIVPGGGETPAFGTVARNADYRSSTPGVSKYR